MKKIPTRLYLGLLLPLSLSVAADGDYPPDIKPIVEGRCMVCHGCYDAPCQLKLDALAGLHPDRGAGFHRRLSQRSFQVPDAHLPGFLKTIELMRSEADYARLVTSYGVRRTDGRFWSLSDRLHTHYREAYPREAGLFDLNRYQNR